eukprot:2911061-Rhodomonas_salina.1
MEVPGMSQEAMLEMQKKAAAAGVKTGVCPLRLTSSACAFSILTPVRLPAGMGAPGAVAGGAPGMTQMPQMPADMPQMPGGAPG